MLNHIFGKQKLDSLSMSYLSILKMNLKELQRENKSPFSHLSFGSGGVIPNCKYAILVAIRPRAVRIA